MSFRTVPTCNGPDAELRELAWQHPVAESAATERAVRRRRGVTVALMSHRKWEAIHRLPLQSMRWADVSYGLTDTETVTDLVARSS
jgi:hypothetical protein